MSPSSHASSVSFTPSPQLGDETNDDKNIPTRIGTETDWTDISSGHSHTCGIRNDGELFCFGDNFYGQLGNGTNDDKNIPTRIGTETDWTHIVLGTYHTCGIRNDGELFCFGFNNVGQLGDGTNGANTDKNTPTRAGVNSDWTHISSGGTYTCGIRNNNDLFCFGNNLSGQLGDGTNNNKNTPSSIPFCGNSVIDTGEECDDGLTPNQDCVHNETSCTVCNVSCEEVSGISHVCGDGFVDTEEECDDANSNSDTDADACRIDCSSPSCGDGVKDTGEDCDDGLTPSQDCAYKRNELYSL